MGLRRGRIAKKGNWFMESAQVFVTLLEEATKPSIEYIQEELQNLAKNFALGLETPVQRVIQDTYRKGLVDGFQQGVAAECNRRDSSGYDR
jgi:hypothetical protein